MTVDLTAREISQRYNRFARWYDRVEGILALLGVSRLRRRVLQQASGKVLEVAVGTGKNLRYYRDGHSVTAIDFSPKMLERARKNAQRAGVQATLQLMDAQALEFPDSTVDSAVSTFVFCSVPDAVLGLREACRVLRPGGRVYLLEHVLSGRQPARWLMQRLNGLMRAIDGANLDRDTVENVELAGFDLVDVQDLWGDIVKLIVAEKPG